jgi:heme/copper-type cytochrome/quinol oxidase subunit 2
MKMKIKKLALIASIFFSFSATLAPALVSAADVCDTNSDGMVDTQEAIQCGTNAASGNQNQKNAGTNVDNTIRTLINVLSIIAGIIAVIMIIITGFRYITSGGKQESVAAAKNTILYAVIGLVIIALAQAIARFVLTNTANSTNPNSSSNAPGSARPGGSGRPN